VAKDQNLHGKQFSSLQEGGLDSADRDTKVAIAAHRLAIFFTEEADLPARFRKSSSSAKSKIVKKDSELERRFKEDVKLWKQLIETMLAKISNPQAWRFVTLSPEVDATVQKLSDCKDFSDFVDYLILRRDKEQCNEDELGGLAMLSVAFQREIEKRI
jgi:hypothetical protein